MVCRDVQENELAEKYLNGQLDPMLRDAFEAHILDCSHCLSSVELLQAVREDLAAHAHAIRSQSAVTGGRLCLRKGSPSTLA
jgi:anti-sigma factor RsiW